MRATASLWGNRLSASLSALAVSPNQGSSTRHVSRFERGLVVSGEVMNRGDKRALFIRSIKSKLIRSMRDRRALLRFV